MLMYTFKKFKVINDHYFDIFDINKRKLKLTVIILSAFFILSIVSPVSSGYILSIESKYSLHSIDNLYDYTLPLVAAMVVFYNFFEDYQNKTFELLAFYSNSQFNYMMFYRWFLIVFIFSIGSLFSGILYFRNIAFLDYTSLLLSIRFIPNIIFLCGLILCATVLTKSSYIGLFVTLSYFVGDLLSSARMFKYFSLGANSNNFYYTISPQYYLVNRIVILLLGVLFIYIACKKSVKI